MKLRNENDKNKRKVQLRLLQKFQERAKTKATDWPSSGRFEYVKPLPT
jgi:hypothetical protein